MSDRALLAHWIKQEKEAERARDEALEEGSRWFRRARLARDAGDEELAARAREKVSEARQKHDEAIRRLNEAKSERDALRSGRVHEVGDAELARSSQIKENFRELGIDPTEAEIDDVASEVAAGDALARLRARMGADTVHSGDDGAVQAAASPPIAATEPAIASDLPAVDTPYADGAPEPGATLTEAEVRPIRESQTGAPLVTDTEPAAGHAAAASTEAAPEPDAVDVQTDPQHPAPPRGRAGWEEVGD